MIANDHITFKYWASPLYCPFFLSLSSCLTIFVCKFWMQQSILYLFEFPRFRLNANMFSWFWLLVLCSNSYLWWYSCAYTLTNARSRTRAHARTSLLCHQLSLKVEASRKEGFRANVLFSVIGLPNGPYVYCQFWRKKLQKKKVQQIITSHSIRIIDVTLIRCCAVIFLFFLLLLFTLCGFFESWMGNFRATIKWYAFSLGLALLCLFSVRSFADLFPPSFKQLLFWANWIELNWIEWSGMEWIGRYEFYVVS